MSVDPVAISRTALDVEWQRLQVIAQNLANENTTRVAGGRAYRPVSLVSGPDQVFARLVNEGTRVAEPHGTRVLGMEVEGAGVRRVHDPRHPDADKDGYVTYPDIDHAHEMTELLKTARAYESNLTVMSLAQQMAMRALDIGRS
jgi:flagellar basal-body rod protein FlgC